MSILLRNFQRLSSQLNRSSFHTTSKLFTSRFPQSETNTAPPDAWDEIETAMFHNEKSKNVKIPPPKSKKPRKPDKVVHVQFTPPEKSHKVNSEIIYDSEIGEYLNLERDDPFLDELMLAVNSKKHRETSQLIVLEGRRLIQEAFLAGLKARYLLFSKIEQLKMLKPLQTGPKLVKVANHNLKFWSQLTTPPGILGIFEKPLDLNTLIEKRGLKTLPVSIICDNIREPSNLGAVIRVAAAAGISQIILTKGCTSPWESKVLRGSSGAHFRIKLIGPVDWPQIWHLVPQDAEIFVAENKPTEPAVSYENMKISGKEKVFIVGNEAHGVSDEAKEFVQEKIKQGTQGSFVSVPLAEGIDSLNVTSATAVILFELKRKINELSSAK